ncbi:MAG: TlpA family protein disulfide reductase [Candidatus Limnocylindria bacterium]
MLATGFQRDPRDIRGGIVGRPAPSFDLPRLDGAGRVRLADELAQGKAVVVYFFASWCVPCKQEYPILVRVWDR